LEAVQVSVTDRERLLAYASLTKPTALSQTVKAPFKG
jgi:hypothetical protein